MRYFIDSLKGYAYIYNMYICIYICRALIPSFPTKRQRWVKLHATTGLALLAGGSLTRT